MTAKIAFAFLALLAQSPASADVAEPPAVLTSSGTGKYEVWCKLAPTSGDDVTLYLQPGRDKLALARVRRADCSFKASSAGPLTVKLSGSGWSCPFKVAAEAPCEMTAPAGSFGEFRLRRTTN